MGDGYFLLTNLLSEDEKKVITSITAHIERGEKRVGIQQIANENFLSTTTIVKMCKRLGFDGYSELYYYLSRQFDSHGKERRTENLKSLIDNYSDELIARFRILLDHSRQAKLFTTGEGFSNIVGSYIAQRLSICGFMRQDLSRVVSAKMIFSKNSKCDFVTESASETGYTTNTKTQGGTLMRLKDKVAIITGGSRGIGYATADKFLKEGATVILTASSQGSADKAVEQLKEKYPDATVAGISPNLSNLESVRNAFREAASKYGCIDILVNNAGVSESTPFTEYTEETFDKVMDLNVKGVFNATRAASECMIAKGHGVVLSTSSMVSIYGQPSGFAYPASKFAVNGLTVSLARELGPKGIRVNAVAPGITLTDMMKAVPQEVIDPLIKQIPLRRLGQPEDIANAFVFLASDEASYITGVVLSVDGMART